MSYDRTLHFKLGDRLGIGLWFNVNPTASVLVSVFEGAQPLHPERLDALCGTEDDKQVIACEALFDFLCRVANASGNAGPRHCAPLPAVDSQIELQQVGRDFAVVVGRSRSSAVRQLELASNGSHSALVSPADLIKSLADCTA